MTEKIGSNLRIRLPVDYQERGLRGATAHAVTLDDISFATQSLIDREVSGLLSNQNTLLSALTAGYVPPPVTRWRRIKRIFQGFGGRSRDAWLVLCGRASIGDYW